MYDAQIISIENSLCQKLALSATFRMKTRYAVRLILRNFRVRHGQAYYKLVERSFFWINGQYAYGLAGTKSAKSTRSLHKFYSFFTIFPLLKLNLVDMPDQYIHAEVLLELYEQSCEKKYLPLVHQAANSLINEVKQHGNILRYGNGTKAYIDTLGMITEFCYHYAQVFGEYSLTKIAEDQMDFFISASKVNGNFYPYHAYDIASNGKEHAGNNSWGRGIGWYLLGLGACVENNAEKYSEIYRKTILNVFSEQNIDGFLFEDMRTRERVDTSTTSMAALSLYAGLKAKVFQGDEKSRAEEYLNKAVAALISATTEDGKVLFCSGECGGANAYSKEYGDYYAQGYTLRLLTQLERNGV